MRGSVYGITTSPRLQVVTCGHTNALQHIHGLRSHLCFCSQDLLYHLTKRRNGLHSERLHLFRVGAFAIAANGQSILLHQINFQNLGDQKAAESTRLSIRSSSGRRSRRASPLDGRRRAQPLFRGEATGFTFADELRPSTFYSDNSNK